MSYPTILTIALLQFIIALPTSFYFLDIGFVGLSFTLFMISGLALIITMYYPLININD